MGGSAAFRTAYVCYSRHLWPVASETQVSVFVLHTSQSETNFYKTPKISNDENHGHQLPACFFRHRQLYLSTYLPWAIQAGKDSQFLLNVYFEQRWHQSLQELRKELNLPDPPLAAGTNQYDVDLITGKDSTDQSVGQKL